MPWLGARLTETLCTVHAALGETATATTDNQAQMHRLHQIYSISCHLSRFICVSVSINTFGFPPAQRYNDGRVRLLAFSCACNTYTAMATERSKKKIN